MAWDDQQERTLWSDRSLPGLVGGEARSVPMAGGGFQIYFVLRTKKWPGIWIVDPYLLVTTRTVQFTGGLPNVAIQIYF